MSAVATVEQQEQAMTAAPPCQSEVQDEMATVDANSRRLDPVGATAEEAWEAPATAPMVVAPAAEPSPLPQQQQRRQQEEKQEQEEAAATVSLPTDHGGHDSSAQQQQP